MSNPPDMRTGGDGAVRADGGEESEGSSGDDQTGGGEGGEDDPSSGGSASPPTVDGGPFDGSPEFENAAQRRACASRATHKTFDLAGGAGTLGVAA